LKKNLRAQLLIERLEERDNPAPISVGDLPVLRNFEYQSATALVMPNAATPFKQRIVADSFYGFTEHGSKQERSHGYLALAAAQIAATGNGTISVEMSARTKISHQLTTNALRTETSETEEAVATLHVRGTGHFTIVIDTDAGTAYHERYYVSDFSDNRVEYIQNSLSAITVTVNGVFDLSLANVSGDRRVSFNDRTTRKEQVATVLQSTATATVGLLGGTFTLADSQSVTSTERNSSTDGGKSWHDNGTRAYFLSSSTVTTSGAVQVQSRDTYLSGHYGSDEVRDRLFASSAYTFNRGTKSRPDSLCVAYDEGNGENRFFDQWGISITKESSQGPGSVIAVLLAAANKKAGQPHFNLFR
jgi:hypothetical protein